MNNDSDLVQLLSGIYRGSFYYGYKTLNKKKKIQIIKCKFEIKMCHFETCWIYMT